MTDKQKEILAAVVLIATFIIPELDEIYITSNMKESGARMEALCHNEPKKCWIQKRTLK